jgi:hypothetical protein
MATFNPPVAPTSSSNGHAVSRQDIQAQLTGDPLTTGYRPTMPLWMLGTDWLPQIYLLRDVELMMIHPMVLSVLNYYKSGISQVSFEGAESPEGPDAPALPISENQEVSVFVHEQCKRYWDVGVPMIQGGYEYGWMGTEVQYTDEQGPLAFDHLVQFSPRDVFLLTLDKVPAGVRVKNVANDDLRTDDERRWNAGGVDLHMATRDVPAKGLWYAHRPRYNSYYGQSQLLGAWRPWRRLAYQDAAEVVLDMAFYRFGYCGPVVHYPEEDAQVAMPGIAGTALDSQGRPRHYARDIARQMAEQAKAGASIGLPSSKYPHDLGGGDKWAWEWPDHSFQGEGILAYIKYLCDQISYGIGVPPELLAAAHTGSGYSGRAIPLEAFLNAQQQLADAMLNLFVTQVLRPLVRWNWGPDVKFAVKIKPLYRAKLESQGKDLKGGQQKIDGSPAGLVHESRHNPGVPVMAGQHAGPGNEPSPPQAAQPGAPMSLHDPRLVTDRTREIARKILSRRAA